MRCLIISTRSSFLPQGATGMPIGLHPELAVGTTEKRDARAHTATTCFVGRGITPVGLGEVQRFAAGRETVPGWFGAQAQAFAEIGAAVGVRGVLVIARASRDGLDDGLTREVCMILHGEHDRRRPLLAAAMMRLRRLGITRLLIGELVGAGIDLDALGFTDLGCGQFGRVLRLDEVIR